MGIVVSRNKWRVLFLGLCEQFTNSGSSLPESHCGGPGSFSLAILLQAQVVPYTNLALYMHTF